MTTLCGHTQYNSVSLSAEKIKCPVPRTSVLHQTFHAYCPHSLPAGFTMTEVHQNADSGVEENNRKFKEKKEQWTVTQSRRFSDNLGNYCFF